MSLRRHRSRRRMSTLHDVNIMNLTDVALVLLIMFILITPLIQEGLELQLPRTRAAEELEEGEAILVVMTAEEKILVDGARVTAEEVGDYVAGVHQAAPKKPVVVKADQALSYGDVIGMIDAIRAAGIVNVGLATENERDLVPDR